MAKIKVACFFSGTRCILTIRVNHFREKRHNSHRQ